VSERLARANHQHSELRRSAAKSHRRKITIDEFDPRTSVDRR